MEKGKPGKSFIEKKKKAALSYMAEFIVGVFFIDCVFFNTADLASLKNERIVLQKFSSWGNSLFLLNIPQRNHKPFRFCQCFPVVFFMVVIEETVAFSFI